MIGSIEQKLLPAPPLIKTLIIGYVPLTDTVAKKPREVRDDTYFKNFLKDFDLGEVHFAKMNDWKSKVDEINPLFIILLGNDYYGTEVHAYKSNALLYTSYDAGQIFYRKAEIEEKKAKQRKTFTEIERLIKTAGERGEKEIEAMRHFSAMSFDDMYKMIKEGILSKDKKLHDQAWDLLFGKGERHSNLIWMRMKFLAETWEHADGKGKEELMCMAMDQFVDEGMARKLEDFTDADGQGYHQYMFCDFNGNDLNYIRRIPFGEKGQEKYAYENLLTRYETPANFMRVMLEAGEIRTKKAEYFKEEAEKVTRVLTEWKADPTKSKKLLMVVPWNPEDSNEEPLTERELGSLKRFLQKHNQSAYMEIFGLSKG